MEAEASKTVLLVDDEEAHLQSLNRIFQKEGFHTLQATSGKQALELLRQHHVHVMLTDLVMPGMNGPSCSRPAGRFRPKPRW